MNYLLSECFPFFFGIPFKDELPSFAKTLISKLEGWEEGQGLGYSCFHI